MACVKGMRDIYGPYFFSLKKVYDVSSSVSYLHGFSPIDTPLLEHSDVFLKSLGDSSDVVTKEMYSFIDKGGKSLTIRPEFTAAVTRAFVTTDLFNLPKPLKLFSYGPVFRHERPQKGRYRQFHQFNCEVIGSDDHVTEAQLILLAHSILQSLKIKARLEINSLGSIDVIKEYKNALISYFSKHKNNLSQESILKIHSNPLRILDSKNPADIEISMNSPNIKEYYDDYSKKHFVQILDSLDQLGIDYVINNKLVRGLDYYSHTIFEFKTNELGAQGTIIAGGRYDNLIESHGGPKMSACGFAGGAERITELLEEDQINTQNHLIDVCIIPIDNSLINKSIIIANKLRNDNLKTIVEHKGNIRKRMSRASKCSYTALFGIQEAQQDCVKLRNMQTGEELVLEISNIAEYILKKRHSH